MNTLFIANCWNNSCGVFRLKTDGKESYWTPLRVTLLESRNLLTLEYGSLPTLKRTLNESGGKFLFEKEDMVDIIGNHKMSTHSDTLII